MLYSVVVVDETVVDEMVVVVVEQVPHIVGQASRAKSPKADVSSQSRMWIRLPHEADSGVPSHALGKYVVVVDAVVVVLVVVVSLPVVVVSVTVVDVVEQTLHMTGHCESTSLPSSVSSQQSSGLNLVPHDVGSRTPPQFPGAYVVVVPVVVVRVVVDVVVVDVSVIVSVMVVDVVVVDDTVTVDDVIVDVHTPHMAGHVSIAKENSQSDLRI